MYRRVSASTTGSSRVTTTAATDRTVGQRCTQPIDARAHLVEEIVGAVAPVAMCERADHEAMLVLHQVEHRRAARGTSPAARAGEACVPSAPCRRRCARTAGVVGEHVGQREQRENLVDAGKRRIDQAIDVCRGRGMCRDR